MVYKLLALIGLIFCLVGCQFTETMVLNEDGTGRMTLSMDLTEMMAISGEMGKDSTMVKQDTVISFKDILEEKKDSIAELPKEERQRLEAMENYNLRMFSDPKPMK